MEIININTILTAIAAILIALNVGPLILKKVQSNKENAETQETAARSDSLQVATAKEVVALVREDLVGKNVEIAEQKVTVKDLVRRIELLEERERHGLVRAAVHEAWDEMAFRKLLVLDPTFPPPPPLLNRAGEEHVHKEIETDGH